MLKKKRIEKLWTVYVIISILLILLILKIVVIDGNKYSIMAVNQRSNTIDIKDYRAMIYDRNLLPLVDSRTYINDLDTKNNPIKISYQKRYDQRSLARHIIGYTDAFGNGISGIEKSFDNILKTDNKYSVKIIKDVYNNPIENIGTKILNQSSIDKNLKLTLNYKIQKIVEENMDKIDYNSAVVVLDVDTFDVLSICSRPNFDQNNVDKYINSDNGELLNRGLSSYNAGSIFKIITSATAIENDLIFKDKMFLCTGSSNIDGTTFKCHKEDGHGLIDFEKAFEYSCNCAFYEIGNMCDEKELEDMAKKFGLNNKVLGLENESMGNLNNNKFMTNIDKANISIGQGEILMTPLQAVKMVAIIANKGIAKDVNILNGIVDENGKIIKTMKTNGQKRVIKESTAMKISEMMRKSVLYGTGKSAKSNEIDICGKTGTAETGWMDNGELMVHGWFVGFFPANNPKYAMSVFIENGKSSNVAAKVFKEISEQIRVLD